ncbi:MAG: hypothetical protein K2Y37_18650 [Pirellulales bacterium]|nr:hypothetical protein [Pirellulales bacterium]
MASLAALVVAGSSLPAVWACPFCSAVSVTLGEELKGATAGVIVKLKKLPEPQSAPDPTKPPVLSDSLARFEIVQVLKGADVEIETPAGLKKLADVREIDVTYFGQDEIGRHFLIMGIDAPKIAWNTPIALTERAVAYVSKMPGLPETGPDRLVYFQEYLEDPEELIARDSYDEFAKCTYMEIKGLKDRMHHDKLVAWIKSPQVTPSRRRLYLCMLGVCGNADDLPMLEETIRSDNRDLQTALDAVIGAYLMLKGESGVPLVEERFLTKKDADYTDTYAAITAIRILGQEDPEQTGIPRARLIEALRHMLDRPQYADLVIADLARWEDWGSMDRLVALFKNATDETNWVRVPVIHFLKACPLPEAKAHIDELAKIDPDAVKRANSFFPLAAPKVPPPSEATTDAASGATAPGSDTTGSGAALTPSGAAAGDDIPLPPPPVADPEDGPVAVDPSTTTADVAAAMAADAIDEQPAVAATNEGNKTSTAVATTKSPADELESGEEEEQASAPQPLPAIATWKMVAIALAAAAALLALYFVILGWQRRLARS